VTVDDPPQAVDDAALLAVIVKVVSCRLARHVA
jgi:hypothetical protein